MIKKSQKQATKSDSKDAVTTVAQNKEFLNRIILGKSHGNNTKLLEQLPKFSELEEFEKTLREQNQITFASVFHEPVGNYLIRTYLLSQHSIDKAIFLSDVELFKKLKNPSAQKSVAQKIFDQFCGAETSNHIPGLSVFEHAKNRNIPWYIEKRKNLAVNDHASEGAKNMQAASQKISLFAEGTNNIGVFGKPIQKIHEKIASQKIDETLFDEVSQQVTNDLLLDIFPRFQQSAYHRLYLRCKFLETKPVTIKHFDELRSLGHGAFGLVSTNKSFLTNLLFIFFTIKKQ
ncbi:hypothetical protein RFI_23956 [Reticulomyxa filosa]|uniref:RGS domain-containing protein n=1 Tax=Reticulomyxa filosa TaxID=46433 RepID=X6MIG3_RETFI|nr:hypothetical protein RFI_23956 [Reticulomyxa filosa]|eukprot:ETO13421.1 hypothetical protein RFI_23956 [Reticulomyxa filosa]